MGLSVVLDTIIGLTFVYCLMSILCSGINEVIAHESGKRGKFLRQGLTNMLGDRGIYLRVINHPLVASLYRDLPGKPRHPSYIPSDHFASALMDVLQRTAGQIGNSAQSGQQPPLTLDNLRQALVMAQKHGYQVGGALLPLLDSADGDLEKVKKRIASWFDASMDRVSGWYKMHTRRTLVVIGILTAVTLNVDSIAIATRLAESRFLRQTIVDLAAQTTARNEFRGVNVPTRPTDAPLPPDQLKKFAAELITLEEQGLPVGFSCLAPPAPTHTSTSALAPPQTGAGPRSEAQSSTPPVTATPLDDSFTDILGRCWTNLKEQQTGNWFRHILGWLITGLAVGLGAPFWFELLNRLVNIRGAGKKPEPQTASQ
jgi:hypothetical protein